MIDSNSGSASVKLLVSGMKNQPLCKKIYTMVTNRPDNIPATAPLLLMRFEKMPIINAGKIDAAARPKAKCHGLRRKARRVKAQIGRHHNGNRHRDTRSQQFAFFRDLRVQLNP